jgi:hypothetical protein
MERQMNEQAIELSIRADGYDSQQLQDLSIIGVKEKELISRLKSSSPLLLEGIRPHEILIDDVPARNLADWILNSCNPSNSRPLGSLIGAMIGRGQCSCLILLSLNKIEYDPILRQPESLAAV